MPTRTQTQVSGASQQASPVKTVSDADAVLAHYRARHPEAAAIYIEGRTVVVEGVRGPLGDSNDLVYHPGGAAWGAYIDGLIRDCLIPEQATKAAA